MDADQPKDDNAVDSAGAGRSDSPDVRVWPVPVILAMAAVGCAIVWNWPNLQSGYPWVITYGIGLVTLLALAGWLLLYSRMAARPKWIVFWSAVAAVALFFGLFRLQFTGDLGLVAQSRWSRHSPTIEHRGKPVDLMTTTPLDVAGFLGPGRRPQYPGIGLDPDWKARPPKLLWRQPIGSGFSSFAVVGDFAVTQQQDGDEELVVCYEWRTGKARWKHAERAYFRAEPGGIGPRATPTVDAGRVYAIGAMGILNCLDGRDGAVVWRRNVLEDNEAENLQWGVSCSPLIVDDLVVVTAGVKDPRRASRRRKHYALVAYDKQSGEPRWHGGTDDASYSSPTLATIAGVRQILIANASSVAAHDPADGRVLWTFPFPGGQPNVAQAVALEDDKIFMSKGYAEGCGVWKIRRDDGRWAASEVWRERRYMQTKFTNPVIRDGFAYGLSEQFLECLALDKPRQRWTTRRHRQAVYGFGQVLLVGDWLLVQSEQGDVGLVEAVPEKFREVARFSAIAGRTWNYPVLVGHHLLVRNDSEAACYELPVHDAP